MNETHYSFLEQPYQGDMYLIFIAILAVIFIVYVIYEASKRRKAGISVNGRGVVVVVIMGLWLVYMSISQILSHHCIVRLMPTQDSGICQRDVSVR